MNDFLGPDRSSAARACASVQNVKFVVLRDSSGFPHAFWEVLPCGVPLNGELLGDYGNSFWESWGEESQDDACVAAPALSPLLLGILCGLRGWSARLPIAVDDGDKAS